MLTFFGSLLGFLTSAFPEILRMVGDAADRKHELDILQMQMEQEKLGFQNHLEEIKINADADISKELYKTYNSGIRWVDALNASVRPVLSYFFFLLYAGIKVFQFHVLNMNLELLWTGDDQIIFASIISFYFGQRAILKLRG